MVSPYATYHDMAERAFQIGTAEDFNAVAMDLFHLHAEKNAAYRTFLDALGIEPGTMREPAQIPYLPISAFKRHRILLDGLVPEITFTSSGTTGIDQSSHHVPWPAHYERSFISSFSAIHGDIRDWRILALLPAYLERTGSSLVYMAERLIQLSGDPQSGTYLYRYKELSNVLADAASGKKTLLIGVTFALLDLAEQYPQQLRNTVVMETGGMKGRRNEMVREEVHARLKQAFGLEAIASEYGMTELLSQAWSQAGGVFYCPRWMRVRIREVNDPFSPAPAGRTGGIDVIDLANVASCPFISTQDLGRSLPDGGFEVLGRFDHSDLRGCNLMVP